MYRTNTGDTRTNQKSEGTYMKNKEPAPPQQKVTGADLAQVTFWKYIGNIRGDKGKIKEITNQETMGMTGAGLSRE